MAVRTQIYLDDEHRRRIDQIRRREGKSLAQVVRDALDQYLDGPEDSETALSETFGAAPGFSVPSRNEWRKRDGRARRG